MTIYLDNSATTRVRPEVVEAMIDFFENHYGNPSSIHAMGRDSYKAMAGARASVSRLLSCSPTEVYFSGCGTMSNNVAILGRARFAEANNHGKHIITSTIEHPSVIGPCKYLESCGWKVTYLAVDSEGFVKLDEFEKAICKDTSIVSIMWVNNEIGSIQPIKEIADIIERSCKKYGNEIFFHTDAVQAAGKVKLDLKNVPVSALSISGHKFHAPKGVGGLFIRRGVNIMPIAFGGGQEKGIMPGTEGLPNIVALGVAAQLACDEFDKNVGHLKEMQEYCFSKLEDIEGVRFTGTKDLDRRLPGHVSVTVENVEGEALVMQLDLKGLCVSSASACHKGIIEPSHVLSALLLPSSMLKGSVRITMGKFNTIDECKRACAILSEVFTSQKPAPATNVM